MERKNERYHRGYQTCDTRFVLRWFESHGPRRALALFCAFFLALQVLFPCKAALAYYPSEEVILGDQVTTDNFGTAGVGYMVIAYNNLRATLLALGVQPTDSRLTSEVRSKLSNASSGGSFYEYSTTFLTQSQLSGELPPWTFGVRDFIDTWETIAGSGDQYGPYMDVFYSSASRELYNNAKTDLNTILAGGSLGGGGSGTGAVIESTYTIDYSDRFNPLSKEYIVYGGWSGTVPDKYGNGLVFVVSVLQSVIDSASSYLDTHPYVCLWSGWPGGVTYFNPGRTYSDYFKLSISSSPWYIDSNGLHTDGDVYSWHDTNRVALNSTTNITINAYLNHLDAQVGQTFANPGWSTAARVSEPVTPPNNWPSDPTPTPPTSPIVPDPPTSTPVDPPSDPVGGTPPAFPIQIITTDTTYPVADLQAVLDAMAEHCEHIRDEIYADTSGLYDNLTTFLANQFQVLRNFIGDENNWLFESLENEFQRMMDYLKDLAEWLADQMEFDISGGDYDDTTVVSWLKRIYLKLGTGGVSTKPVDPVADPVGAWDWLAALINNILSALAGGAAALTGTLGELFNGIRTKFPFSIPWDVVAIVTLFDAAPVTPAFTIAYTVFGANVRYDIDLHFFDQQAAMIRAVENVLFCAYLLFKTDWLLNVFGGLSNFLGVKAAGVLKG